MPIDNIPIKRKPITLEEHLQLLEERLAVFGGEIAVLRNPGTRRTASKQALLDAIRATGKIW
ncbi:hypothetical protein ACQEPB_06105 [Novosphingobium fluoreni]|uniref:hypothetical protein n=1 Tax=Novosphingobium fluoreni TaxID=1391222 RepID=UPI003DA00958